MVRKGTGASVHDEASQFSSYRCARIGLGGDYVERFASEVGFPRAGEL